MAKHVCYFPVDLLLGKAVAKPISPSISGLIKLGFWELISI